MGTATFPWLNEAEVFVNFKSAIVLQVGGRTQSIYVKWPHRGHRRRVGLSKGTRPYDVPHEKEVQRVRWTSTRTHEETEFSDIEIHFLCRFQVQEHAEVEFMGGGSVHREELEIERDTF